MGKLLEYKQTLETKCEVQKGIIQECEDSEYKWIHLKNIINKSVLSKVSKSSKKIKPRMTDDIKL